MTFLLPLLSVWVIAGYIHTLHLLHVFDLVRSRMLVCLFFLPVLAGEFYFSLHPFQASAGIPNGISSGWWTVYGLKALYWSLFFTVWVLFMKVVAERAMIVKFFITRFYLQFYILFRAQRWRSVAALAVWLTIYYVVTVRLGMFRIGTAMILPAGLSFLLLFDLYHNGGVGAIAKKKLLAQVGLEKLFEFKRMGTYKIPRHPRGIHYDAAKDALFVMFGATYGQRREYPTIIRRDLGSGRMQAFVSKNIRRVGFDESSRSLYVAPWYQDHFYRLHMDELKIRSKCPNQIDGILQTWEPMDIVKDVSADRIYIGNDGEQALVSYHSDTGKIERVLNLVTEKAVGLGGPVWHIRQSRKTRKLYFITGPGRQLFEVDPDSLRILRKRKFWDVIGTALLLDDEKNLLYYQNGGITNGLYEIDIASFEIRRTFKGEGHARRLALDRNRDALYVLGYLSGTLLALDLASGNRAWKVRVGGLPHGMDLCGDTLWINSMAGVLKLDLNQLWNQA